MDAQALSQEFAYYEECKLELLKTSQGHFVLVKGRELHGAFHTFEEAYKAGLEKFGHVPFLIKQVLEIEPVQHIPALAYGLLSAAL